MRERPILFNGAMVRAILAGQKTQTRRVVKPAPPASHLWAGWCSSSTCHADEGKAVWAAGEGPLMHNAHRVACPFGKPGDRLWVRETWAQHPDYRDARRAVYLADPGAEYDSERWRPSIHMPRWACRLVLEITAVRVERLQDICAADCHAEGTTPDRVRAINLFGCTREEREDTYRRAALAPFRELWASTGGDWASNPWVWVIEFKKVEVTP